MKEEIERLKLALREKDDEVSNAVIAVIEAYDKIQTSKCEGNQDGYYKCKLCNKCVKYNEIHSHD